MLGSVRQGVSYYMVNNNALRRAPGRPRSFDPDAALDQAIALFWAEGFEAVDVERIARAVGVTKPSLYRLFGDKSSLFLYALQRYGALHGTKALAAFAAEPDVAKAVAAFLELTVRASTQKGRPLGCLLACIAMGEAGRSAVVRAFCAQALTGLVALLTERFEQETKAGHLSARPSARTRAQLLADTVQGIALRARAGISRSDLLRDARNYPALILR